MQKFLKSIIYTMKVLLLLAVTVQAQEAKVQTKLTINKNIQTKTKVVEKQFVKKILDIPFKFWNIPRPSNLPPLNSTDQIKLPKGNIPKPSSLPPPKGSDK